jgi:hypothetical protein
MRAPNPSIHRGFVYAFVAAHMVPRKAGYTTWKLLIGKKGLLGTPSGTGNTYSLSPRCDVPGTRKHQAPVPDTSPKWPMRPRRN